jgi:hypothetical protein
VRFPLCSQDSAVRVGQGGARPKRSPVPAISALQARLLPLAGQGPLSGPACSASSLQHAPSDIDSACQQHIEAKASVLPTARGGAPHDTRKSCQDPLARSHASTAPPGDHQPLQTEVQWPRQQALANLQTGTGGSTDDDSEVEEWDLAMAAVQQRMQSELSRFICSPPSSSKRPAQQPAADRPESKRAQIMPLGVLDGAAVGSGEGQDDKHTFQDTGMADSTRQPGRDRHNDPATLATHGNDAQKQKSLVSSSLLPLVNANKQQKRRCPFPW